MTEVSLVIQTSFIGDMVLTTPLLAELATRGPVDVVATPAGAPLLANHPAVREVLVFDKRRAMRGVRGTWRMAKRIAERHAGVAYLAQGSMRSAALAMLAKVPERVGFDSSAGRRLYTRAVPYRERAHHAERLWALAMPPGAAASEGRLRPRLYPGDAERAMVDQLLRGSPLEGRRFVALAPGSVWATKRWPFYAELAALLKDTPIAIVGGAADGDIARTVAAASGTNVVDCTGRLPLLASAELIGRAAALVTNDSAPLHLASAMATPTLAIFGPTVPAFGFGPLAPVRDIAEHEALPCRPCDRHGPRTCPLGHWRCMRDLSPALVAGRLRVLLGAS